MLVHEDQRILGYYVVYREYVMFSKRIFRVMRDHPIAVKVIDKTWNNRANTFLLYGKQ